jgi:probable HAF family extracellular repeat protein
MTKQKWLVALLVGSSIGCFCDADWSFAQSLSGLKYRLQVLPNQCTDQASCAAGGLSNPLSINNLDWASGAINPPSDLIGHPGLWRRASQSGNQSWRLTDLGTLGGPNAEIDSPQKNEVGWLAGRSDIDAPDPYAESFCGWVCSGIACGPIANHICQGFLWRQETNKIVALPPITPPRCNSHFKGGCNSVANAANNNRQIAGIAENGVMKPGCAAPQVFLYEGVVWSLDASGAPFIQRRLPPVTGDTVSQAYGLNDAGIVVGASGGCAPPNTPASPPLRAVLWKDGGMPLVLGTLGGSQAIASGINKSGQVVGESFLPGDTVVHIFLWQEGMGMKDLGSLLSDDTGVGVQSINNLGEVVGWSCGPSEPNILGITCGPLYWRNGMTQPIDLNQLTQPPHLQMCCASDINDAGEIVVAAFDPSYNGGDFRAAVLVPQQGGQPTAESLPVQNAAAVQRSILPSATLQRLNSHLRGWKIAR